MTDQATTTHTSRRPDRHPKWPDGIDMRLGDRGVFKFEADDGDFFAYDEIGTIHWDELSLHEYDIASPKDAVWRAPDFLAFRVAPEDVEALPLDAYAREYLESPSSCVFRVTHKPTGETVEATGETPREAVVKAFERLLSNVGYRAYVVAA